MRLQSTVIWALAAVATCAHSDEPYGHAFTKKHLSALKSRTKEMFDHAWDSYLDHGFPADEVRPLSCVPFTKDPADPLNIVRNDVMGNFSLTVFDNLDTFVLLEEPDIFKKLVNWVSLNYQDFAIDSNVQVFETNIRILGGLLSAHLYASDSRRGFAIEGYDGFLLRLAHDLGSRLLLAFDSKTSIPFPRTNLKYGPAAVPKSLQRETCTSGAGSPVLEFTLLSRLTGDYAFENASKKAFDTLWTSRTDLDLLPMTVDPHEGKWLDSVTGIGASIDSFYEYALKTAILFDDDYYMAVWNAAYQGLNVHAKTEWVYEVVGARDGHTFTTWIDSLSAFWPGLQVLAGDVASAIRFHAVYMKIWQTFQAIPERWNMGALDQEFVKLVKDLPSEKRNQVLVTKEIDLEWYPLRPEFIESTYHLYRATRDPVYLQVGQDFLKKLETRFKAPCGFAGILDIRTDQRQDRMESFVLSETLKYLYLLFDDENAVHKDEKMIFSTEAHPMWFDKSLSPGNTGFDWFVDFKKREYDDADNVIKISDGTSIFKWSLTKLLKAWWFGDDAEPSENSVAPASLADSLMVTFQEKNAEKLTSGDKTELKKIFDDLNSGQLYRDLNSETEIVDVSEIHSLVADAVNAWSYEFNSELKKAVVELLSSIAIIRRSGEESVVVLQHERRPMANVTKYGFQEGFYRREQDTCPIPVMYSGDPVQLFMTSPLLSEKWFYHLDYKYGHSLIRPMFLSRDEDAARSGNDVELAYGFYRTFTEHLKVQPQSVRLGTTEIFEGSFEPLSYIRENRVSYLEETGAGEDASPLRDGDLYIDSLAGVRLRIEKLQKNRIDSFSREITADDLKGTLDGTAYRVLKLNGVDIGLGQNLWLRADKSAFAEIDTQRVIPLMIQNTTVSNVFLWFGD